MLNEGPIFDKSKEHMSFFHPLYIEVDPIPRRERNQCAKLDKNNLFSKFFFPLRQPHFLHFFLPPLATPTPSATMKYLLCNTRNALSLLDLWPSKVALPSTTLTPSSCPFLGVYFVNLNCLMCSLIYFEFLYLVNM